MDYPINLGSLVTVYHESTGAWYPALILAEEWDSDGSFYRAIWLHVPPGVTNSEAYVRNKSAMHLILALLVFVIDVHQQQEASNLFGNLWNC
eukprot:6444577-Ditylum_brightwellii.AAC.1